MCESPPLLLQPGTVVYALSTGVRVHGKVPTSELSYLGTNLEEAVRAVRFHTEAHAPKYGLGSEILKDLEREQDRLEEWLRAARKIGPGQTLELDLGLDPDYHGEWFAVHFELGATRA